MATGSQMLLEVKKNKLKLDCYSLFYLLGCTLKSDI